jgi:sugar phosphate isomerase/epimerase
MTFKLGYCSLRWQNPELEPALEALKAAGWDGWEARLPLNWLGTPQRVRRVCDNVGMPLTIFTANGTPDNRDRENVELNKRRIDFAAELGADCFMYMNGRKPEGRPVTDDDVKAAAEGAEDWAEYAAQYGLELSYHVHTNLLVDSSEHWKLYMSLLDKAKLCIDVSHVQLWGYDPIDAIRDFKDQLNYVHLQDWSAYTQREDGFHDPTWVSVGEAEACDFPGIAEVLKEIGYNRWVTGCPGAPKPGKEDPLGMAQDSKSMYEYMRKVGY